MRFECGKKKNIYIKEAFQELMEAVWICEEADEGAGEESGFRNGMQPISGLSGGESGGGRRRGQRSEGFAGASVGP